MLNKLNKAGGMRAMAQCIHAKLVAKFMNQFLHVGMSE